MGVGQIVPVWFMSNKFGSTQYQRGNGTFSNIIIRSTIVTDTTTTTPTETSNVITSAVISTNTPNHNGDSNRGNDTQTISPLIVIIIVATILLICIVGPFLFWRYKLKPERSEEHADMEIKHLSMMYLGTTNNGEISPPSVIGGGAGRPRNIQNLPELPLSPKMVSPGNGSPGKDSDDMKTPFMSDEKDDDEIEDMFA